MAARPPGAPNLPKGSFSDVGIAIAVLTIVSMLILPLPAWLLDFCLVLNLTSAAVVLMITLYATEPLQVSVFPSLLLVMTLFRLALNIAATKLILSSGQPGHIIEAFGQVVLGGNFVVGVIAFLVLVVVQFVVITNGAQRVAEVAARFTLDAMPGKQMSIDADLQAGLIDDKEAKARRRKTEDEASFYGAMDGASKFVRGDAMAAILIIIINIVGGFVIGIMNGQSDALTILKTYTLLTVGEGLVSQIPALLISTATGMLVTRSASEKAMGQEFAAQMFRQPRPLMLAGGLMLAIMLVPGFPKLPLLVVGGGAVAMALTLKRDAERTAAKAVVAERKATQTAAKAHDDPMRLLSVDAILLELGSNLVAMALPDEGGDLADRVAHMRRQMALELGIVLPMVRIRDNLQLPPNRYVIKMRDQSVAEFDLMRNHYLAIDSGTVIQAIDGVPTKEPAFGGSAIWVPGSQRERASMAGYLLADAPSVLITHLTEVIRQHSHELLTRQELQGLLEAVKEHNRVVVDELIPNLLSLGEVQKVLQNLLRERVSIRDLGSILETLADWAPRTKDADQLTEYARAALGRQICQQYLDDQGALSVLTMDPALEAGLRDAVQMGPTGVTLAMEPRLASALLTAVNDAVDRAARQGYTPVLLCSSQIRLAIRRFCERRMPSLNVLAYNEVVVRTEVRSVGTVENPSMAMSGIAA